VSAAGSGIDFFVGYAETEGALAELVPEGAVLVLPEEMRAALNLPEEIGLTEDPETAREDGFLLITAGHPLLMTAAGTVLARGDVGCSSLPRPTGLPPTPSALEGKAREQIHADHGRIDVTGTPEATNLVVLRVGALLTYSVSMDERVQELEEVWVLAETGRAIPAELSERLRAAALEPAVGAGIMAPTVESVARAHDLLCARARLRVDDLSRQTSVRLRGQLDVVDDYYGRVLSSIDERLHRCASDRVAMLTEQAEATKREWARRRSEVADDLTPSFEVRPFRLHLIAVPSYTVQCVIRRGARAHPVLLSYVPILSSFLVPHCPTCASESVLVAGKDGLGCRSCMPPPPSPGAVAATGRYESGEPTVSGTHVTKGAGKDARPEGRPMVQPGQTLLQSPGGTGPSTSQSKSAATPAARAPKRSTGRVTPKGTGAREATAQTGVRTAMSFWSSVCSGELRPRDAVPNSPMRALLRLYGVLGPAYVIGVEDAGRMTSITASPVFVGSDGICSTEGDLKCTGEADAPFALFWRPGSRSNLIEVEGLPLERLAPLFARRDEYGRMVRRRYRQFLLPPPEPMVELDPTAEVLLDRAAQFGGLGYAMRCMAAWEYATEREEGGNSSTESFDPSRAAAIESVVSKRLSMRITAPMLAERYECPVDGVRRHMKLLQPVVRDCTDLRW
jgi:hypothetical protein